MSIEAISGSSPSMAPKATQSASSTSAQKPEAANELTTVTTKCDKKHTHDQSCPHTVSTAPAPRFGEKGHLIDKKV